MIRKLKHNGSMLGKVECNECLTFLWSYLKLNLYFDKCLNYTYKQYLNIHSSNVFHAIVFYYNIKIKKKKKW